MASAHSPRLGILHDRSPARRHGIYQFFDTQDPGYGDRLLETPDFGCDTIWEWLNAQGLTVGLINVPMSHPPRGLDGYELTWPLRKTLRFSHPQPCRAMSVLVTSNVKSKLGRQLLGTNTFRLVSSRPDGAKRAKLRIILRSFARFAPFRPDV